MKAKKIRLKDLTSAVAMDYQPVCLSVCLSIEDLRKQNKSRFRFKEVENAEGWVIV